MILALLGCARVDAPEKDTAEPEDDVVCPPGEPTGLEVGDRAADVAFTDCAGVATSLHGLCGGPALVVSWYGWCATCQDNAELARELADSHPDLQVAVALEEDPLGDPVDGALCDSYEQTWPSAAAAWLDADKGLEAYGTTDLVIVLARDGTLRFVRETATESAIVDAVEAVLAE